VSVALLLVTHTGVGKILLQTAAEVLGVCPLPAGAVSVAIDCQPEAVLAETVRLLDALDQGQGVLVLTDLYGSTPSNIACRLRHNDSVRVVSGINLPMLIRILNYPNLDLDELLVKAVSGGRDGVLTCHTEGNHAG
jgi:PTS system ascorbate-specific IIA component